MKIPHEFSRPVRIGSGTFSTVYRVYQPELERYISLKIVSLSKDRTDASIDREMRILASLQLSCVPHIYAIKRFKKQIILVMEWIRGVPLSLLFKQSVSDECRMTIATSIVKNLALLHTSKVIHGDLKPENILVTSDMRVFFVDFGFSFLKSPRKHSNGVIQGTPGFMAPELWSCDFESINHAKVDLYAAGVVLSEWLGDALPAVAKNLTASDPGLRPSDAAAFEKIWSEKVKCEELNETCDGVIAAAVQEYIAGMLLIGAREHFFKGKREDAYALLTESLEIWPDQNEALEFLQQKYSSPVIKYGRKRLLGAVAGTFIAGVLLVLAYIAGRQDSVSGILGSDNISIENAPVVMRVLQPKKKPAITDLPVVLREIGGGMNLVGMISIICNHDVNGKLIVDGTPIPDFSKGTISIELKAGSHRVEWIDSVSGKRFNEIVELLPFEYKKISAKRFVDGKRK